MNKERGLEIIEGYDELQTIGGRVFVYFKKYAKYTGHFNQVGFAGDYARIEIWDSCMGSSCDYDIEVPLDLLFADDLELAVKEYQAKLEREREEKAKQAALAHKKHQEELDYAKYLKLKEKFED